MSLASLIATGTKVWLDGVDPGEIRENYARGITGATSNPTIVSKIIGRGGFDGRIGELIGQGLTDDQIAWALDDELVEAAQKVFLPAWVRELRAGPAYRGPGRRAGRRGARAAIPRTRPEMVGGSQKPNDQGSRVRGRA